MKVSRHAQIRFVQRINAVANPMGGVMEMWNRGVAATSEDLEIYKVNFNREQTYRVGKFKGESGLLIACNDVIITIIPYNDPRIWERERRTR